MEQPVRTKDTYLLIAISFFLTFTLFLYAPVSIYIANRSELWFNLRLFWYFPLIVFLLSFSALILIGYWMKGKLKALYLSLLFGVALCFYLQGNFLGIKVGSLDGSQINWDEYQTKMWLNIGVWVMFVVCCVCFFMLKYTLAKKTAFYISVLLSIMQVGSLAVSMVPLIGNEQSEFNTTVLPTLTREGLYDVGSEENIVVFLLDAYDEKMFDYVRQNAPDVIKDLDGFVFYDNFTSTFSNTASSLTCLMSGKLFKNQMPRFEWIEKNAEDRLYLDELIDRNFSISIYTTNHKYIAARIKDSTYNWTEAPMKIKDKRSFVILLYRLVACQYFPDLAKPRAWMRKDKFNETREIESAYTFYDDSNALFKSELDENGLSVKQGGKEYKFIHLFGTHDPYSTDEWGNEATDIWDWKSPAIGCMRIMSDYFSKLKEVGLYDNSTIIIMADHGYGGGSGIFGNPIFMIKEKGARGGLQICSYEAGLENYGATIADLAGVENVSDYGLSILRATEKTSFDRYYYQLVLEGVHGTWEKKDDNFYLVEYLTNEKTNDPALFTATDTEILPSGERIAHKKYCETCQKPNEGIVDYEGWPFHEHIHVLGFPY